MPDRSCTGPSGQVVNSRLKTSGELSACRFPDALILRHAPAQFTPVRPGFMAAGGAIPITCETRQSAPTAVRMEAGATPVSSCVY